MSERGPASILVGVDFSEPSRRAFDTARALSQATGAPIVLAHVLNWRSAAGAALVPEEISGWLARERDQAGEVLSDWASEARRDGVELSVRLEEGAPSQVLPEIARAIRAGLVVLGRRGAANLAHVLLGSVSERVLYQSPCPVLVVPGRAAGTAVPRGLLVGIDFSSAAADAYRLAAKLAAGLGEPTRVVLVHVRPPDLGWLESGLDLVDRGPVPFDLAALERWAERSSEDLGDHAFQMADGRAEEVLVATAEREQCDWIVVGRQGRTALAAFLIGSTTDRLLKLTDRPVLVVPQSEAAPGEPTD